MPKRRLPEPRLRATDERSQRKGDGALARCRGEAVYLLRRLRFWAEYRLSSEKSLVRRRQAGRSAGNRRVVGGRTAGHSTRYDRSITERNRIFVARYRRVLEASIVGLSASRIWN